MKRREILTPDLTPLIDVVFILLIFFIVSSVFKKEELALALNLPDSHAQEVEVQMKQLSIELSSTQVAYMGKRLSLEELDEKLSKVKDNKKDIIVRIDKDVAYEKVVKVLDVLQKYNLNNLALVTNSKE
ncbi:MAG: biopolymer transporter ExbD [Campylobacterota bacterium]|nr:biopolymer transporter ExbD [Campylobacterota bacterium]